MFDFNGLLGSFRWDTLFYGRNDGGWFGLWRHWLLRHRLRIGLVVLALRTPVSLLELLKAEEGSGNLAVEGDA